MEIIERLVKQLKRGAGFTMLELLIVIAIIGILVSMGTVAYSSAQKRARDSKRVSDMKAIQSGLEQYYADNNSYPAAGSNCNPGTTYLPGGVPSDAKPSPHPAYAPSNCTTTTYCYCATLEGTGGNATNATCTFGSGAFFCVRNLQ